MVIHSIPAHQIAAAIATIGTFADRNGSLAILFQDAASIAAPFLLFRLKRTGYSSCRVAREAGGLLLTARR